MGLGSFFKPNPAATFVTPTLASASALSIPDGSSVFLVSGSTTIATLTAYRQPGRRITLIGASSASITVTNNSDPTTEGQIDLGGSNRTLAQQDVLELIQLLNGTWVMVSYTDN